MIATTKWTQYAILALKCADRPTVRCRVEGDACERVGRISVEDDGAAWVEAWHAGGWLARPVGWPELLDALNDRQGHPILFNRA